MKVVFDLDGVLIDIREQVRQYLPEGHEDWDAYFEHTMDCPPIEPMLKLLEATRASHSNSVYLLTARPESNRSLTTRWLRECFPTMRWDADLVMRPSSNKQPSSEFKLQVIEFIKPDLVFEDDPLVVEAVSNAGFIVLQVHGFRIDPTDRVPYGGE